MPQVSLIAENPSERKSKEEGIFKPAWLKDSYLKMLSHNIHILSRLTCLSFIFYLENPADGYRRDIGDVHKIIIFNRETRNMIATLPEL